MDDHQQSDPQQSSITSNSSLSRKNINQAQSPISSSSPNTSSHRRRQSAQPPSTSRRTNTDPLSVRQKRSASLQPVIYSKLETNQPSEKRQQATLQQQTATNQTINESDTSLTMTPEPVVTVTAQSTQPFYQTQTSGQIQISQQPQQQSVSVPIETGIPQTTFQQQQPVQTFVNFQPTTQQTGQHSVNFQLPDQKPQHQQTGHSVNFQLPEQQQQVVAPVEHHHHHSHHRNHQQQQPIETSEGVRPPSPPLSTDSSGRTLSLSDTDLYYMTLPPVKIGQQQPAPQSPQTTANEPPQSARPGITFQDDIIMNSPPPKDNQQQNQNDPYAAIRSIRFEGQSSASSGQHHHHKPSKRSKSMRTLPAAQLPNPSSPQRRQHYQSTFQNIKITPESFVVANTIRQAQSRPSLQHKSMMRAKSTNLSHMRLTYSDSEISDTTEINNNYLDNTNASDNEAVAILPLEARELLMQEEEERKSRLAKESTSLLKLPSFGGRRESKYFPGRIRKRVILKNGNINLCPEHVDKRSQRYLQDTFTTMVDIRWRWNLLVFAMGFIMSWFGFSIIWWLIAFSHSDFENLHNEDWTPCVANLKNFASAFLFSIETQHTIGYGSRYTTEECPEAMFVMCLQSITGVMIQCFMVGFVFAKLSRPQKRSQTLMFSRYAIVNTRDSKLCLMFRVGDLRDRSHIIGATISAQLIRKKITSEGEMIPYFHQKLNVKFDELDDELFLIWPAIIVHVIDENSPFYNMNIDDMVREKFEIIAILEGTVESTGQTVQARTSYLPSEILWGHRFEQLIRYRHDTGEYLVDYSKFNNTFDVETPLCSAKELAEEMKRAQDKKISSEEESEDGLDL